VASYRKFYGWKLVAALFSLDFLNMGFPYFGGTVINTYMLRQIPMSRSTFGLGFTLVNLFIGLPSTIVAVAILRWGLKATFAIGSALIFIGALGLSLFATKPWHYLVGFGVIIAGGISFSTLVPVTTAVTRWFRRYRGRAMAIPLSASGFAGFLGAPFINKMLSANGGNWRQAWQVIAAIALLSGIIAFLFVKERPEDLGQLVDGIRPGAHAIAKDGPHASTDPMGAASLRITTHNWSPGEAYRTLPYWMIVIGGTACQFPYFLLIAHWILHLRGEGVPASDAAWAMGLLTLGGIVGRLIGGWLMDKITARYAFMFGLCCYVLGSALALQGRGALLSVAFGASILYGVGFGWTFICMNTMTAHFYGPAAYPKLNGMMLLLTGLISSPAGLVGGELFDRYRSYTPAFILVVLLSLIGIVALSFATRPDPLPEQT
jgi:MFS family permease